jgi:hypothetical protein
MLMVFTRSDAASAASSSAERSPSIALYLWRDTSERTFAGEAGITQGRVHVGVARDVHGWNRTEDWGAKQRRLLAHLCEKRIGILHDSGPTAEDLGDGLNDSRIHKMFLYYLFG